MCIEADLYEDLDHESYRSPVNVGGKAFDDPTLLKVLEAPCAGRRGQADHLCKISYSNAPIALQDLQHLYFKVAQLRGCHSVFSIIRDSSPKIMRY